MDTPNNPMVPYIYTVVSKNPSPIGGDTVMHGYYLKYLIKGFDHWLQIPIEKLEEISAIIKLVHEATLIIDDIEDSSLYRKKLPAAYRIFGQPLTINSGYQCLFQAQQRLCELGNVTILSDFTREMICLHNGQGLDIMWRDSYICPTVEQYCGMVTQKSGGMLRLIWNLMQVYSSEKLDIIPLINELSIYLQIADDYTNLVNFEDADGVDNDITEGKYSYPVLYAILNGTEQESMTIRNIVKLRTSDKNILRIGINIIRDISFIHVVSRLESMKTSLLTQITNFGGNKILTSFIESVTGM